MYRKTELMYRFFVYIKSVFLTKVSSVLLRQISISVICFSSKYESAERVVLQNLDVVGFIIR